MFTFDDIKMMYDWGCFTDEQVMEFVPLCITEDEYIILHLRFAL